MKDDGGLQRVLTGIQATYAGAIMADAWPASPSPI